MAEALTVDDLRGAATGFFTRESSSLEIRAIAEGRRTTWDGDRWGKASRDLGYGALLVPEADGGLGLSARHAVVALEAAGAVASPSPVRSSLLAQAALRWSNSPVGDDAERARTAQGLLVGDVIAVVVDPLDGGRRSTLRVSDTGSVSGTAHAVADAVDADRILFCDSDGHLFVVDVDPATVSVERSRGLDPGRSHGRVTVSDAACAHLGDLPGSAALTDIALLLRAAEQVGVGAGATRVAAAHACDRTQFDAAIGSRQAVSHRLAGDVVATEKASALVAATARSLDNQEWNRLARLAPLAGSAAARASVGATRSMLQVLGGIGFTWEHDAQFWFRRAVALAAAIATPERLDDLAVARGAIELLSTDGGDR